MPSNEGELSGMHELCHRRSLLQSVSKGSRLLCFQFILQHTLLQIHVPMSMLLPHTERLKLLIATA